MGQAKQFDEKINTIKTQFFSALDDFKKYYVYYNKNPEVNEFQNFYINSKTQLQSMSRDIFLTTNNIDKNIELLDKAKKLNGELMKVLTNLENTQNGSEILIDDSKNSYNTQYYYNWEIFIGILIISGMFANFFKSSAIHSSIPGTNK
jgi:midasin (ATPase involved in ribosome maturation)